MAPIYEELGQKFSEDSNIIIAKIDLTKNEIPNSGVEGFPTLKFYPASKGSRDQIVIPYEGDRTLDDMVKFITEKR
jgi:protein disulfide-isomerase A1